MTGNELEKFDESIIRDRIYSIRGFQVMLDRDLAKLYRVETRILNQAVKRNKERFPDEFCFLMNNSEVAKWRSQIVMSNSVKIGLRWKPYVFTEQGVAMLSSILNSKRAIQVNIAIMRAFVKLREILSTHKELAQKLKELEYKMETHDEQITAIFEAINQLLTSPPVQKRKIGFEVREKGVSYAGK